MIDYQTEQTNRQNLKNLKLSKTINAQMAAYAILICYKDNSQIAGQVWSLETMRFRKWFRTMQVSLRKGWIVDSV